MVLLDLILVPIYLVIFYSIAYYFRPKVTNSTIRKYFIPALTVKFTGSIALGLIYFFYYPGGDTRIYYLESKIIFKAFLDDPIIGLKLFLANGEFDPDTYSIASRMLWYTSHSEYIIVKITAFFSLLSFWQLFGRRPFFCIFQLYRRMGFIFNFFKDQPQTT